MGATPSKEELLYQQVQSGNHDAVKSLRRDGVSLEWIDKEGRTPLLLACSRGELLDMTITLLKLGANLKAYCAGSHGGYPLHYAAKRGLDKTVTLLLSRGANPLALNDDGQTPLDLARSRGHAIVVRLLEEQMSFFTGVVRELSGPGIFESLAASLITRKVWAVVLPQKRCDSAGAPMYELAIYEPPKFSLWNGLRSSSTHPAGFCNIAEPQIVIALAEAEMEEPDLSLLDPFVCIWDRVHRMKIKLFSQKRGDKEQLTKLYRACKGMLEGQTQSVVSLSGTDHVHDECIQEDKKQVHIAKLMVSQRSLSSCKQPIPHSASAPSSGRFTSCSSKSITTESTFEDFAFALALKESIQTATAESLPCLPDDLNPCFRKDQQQDPPVHACDGWSFQEPHGKYEAKITNSHSTKSVKSVSQRWKSSSFRFLTRSFREICDGEVRNKGSREFPSASSFPDKPQIHYSPAETANSSKCVVCYDASAEGVCIPCGHLAGCMDCLTIIHSEGSGCPICRSMIDQVIKVYTV